jgi:hypothetical protein
MNPGTERDLVRRLADRLPEEPSGELERRFRSDPELARAFERLEAAWQGLSLPEPAPAPLGFSHRVMARVREEAAARGGLSLRAAPTWVRAAAAAALAVGITLGAVGAHYGSPGSPAGTDPSGRDLRPASLADSYWAAVADDDADPGDGAGDEGEL